MAPQFALFLSPEGIALAHRQSGGHWAVLGDTPLDVPDLGAALVVLLKLAEARAGKDVETLVILPDDQVLYTSLTAPGPDEDTRLWQIREGLEGLTPYAVDELVFDWAAIDDGRVKLAVVAQETLDEARDFAEGHGFRPVGFGARPLDNRFPGVAHFDRSLDWTAEIPDIEFGHDTWQAEPDDAPPAAEPDDAPAPGDAAPEADAGAGAARDVPADKALGDHASEETPPAAPDAPASDPAPGDVAAARVAGDTLSGDISPPPAKAKDSAPPAPQEAPAPAAGPQQTPPGQTADTGPEDAAVPSGSATGAEIAPERATRRRLTLTAEDAAPGSGEAEEPPTTPPDQPAGDDSAQEPAAQTPEAPISLPAGFGARRRRVAPETAGKLLRNRKTRFGPGASDSPAPAAPDLPRRKPSGKADREEPALGRATGTPPRQAARMLPRRQRRNRRRKPSPPPVPSPGKPRLTRPPMPRSVHPPPARSPICRRWRG